MAERHRGRRSDEFHNVGVVGKSGSGKSSLINAFFGLHHGEEYSAKIDVVECTDTCSAYSLPGSPVALWDVPGFGTQKFPDDKSYLEKVNFSSYDFYLLVSSTKVTEFELTIHNAIAEQGKRYFYVRTKMDQDLKNQKRAHPRSFKEEEEKLKIKRQIQEYFSDVPVFLVNSFDPDQFDFPDLRALVHEGARFSKASHRDVSRRLNFRNHSKCSLQ